MSSPRRYATLGGLNDASLLDPKWVRCQLRRVGPLLGRLTCCTYTTVYAQCQGRSHCDRFCLWTSPAASRLLHCPLNSRVASAARVSDKQVSRIAGCVCASLEEG